MLDPCFPTRQRPARRGTAFRLAWRRLLRTTQRHALRILGMPAEELEASVDDLTNADIQVYEDPLFILITVNGRPYYLHR